MPKYLETVECFAMAKLGLVIPRKISSVVDMYSYYLKARKPEFHGIGKIVLIYSHKDDVFSDGSVLQITCNHKESDENNKWKSERSEYLKVFYKRLTDYFCLSGLGGSGSVDCWLLLRYRRTLCLNISLSGLFSCSFNASICSLLNNELA